MKKFLLFKFNNKKPRGGWSDFVNNFLSLKDAFCWMAKIKREKGETVQLIDGESKKAFKPFSEEEISVINQRGAEPISVKTSAGDTLSLGVEHFFYVFFAKSILKK
jgi:hypothetical protein